MGSVFLFRFAQGEGHREFTTKGTKDTKNGFGSSCSSISNRWWSTKARACTDMCLDCGYRVNLLVEDKLISELKAVKQITGEHFSKGMYSRGIHEAQLLTYRKLAGVKTGLLMNFSVTKA